LSALSGLAFLASTPLIYWRRESVKVSIRRISSSASDNEFMTDQPTANVVKTSLVRFMAV